MIYEFIGDLLDEELDFTHIIHQANLYGVMGSGLALQIKNRYKEAYHADLLTKKGDKSKLGTYSKAFPECGPVIYNLYSQIGIGSKDRRTSYDAMDAGLRLIREDLRKDLAREDEEVRVGIPNKLGCGLANGDWEIVSAIISSVFAKEEFSVTIVELKGS